MNSQENRLLYTTLRAESTDLADSFDRISETALEIWNEPRFRAHTAHAKPHIDQVECNLDRLTLALQRSEHRLISEEIYVLLAACHLHDIGMQLGVDDARERHAEYTFELILHSQEPWEQELYVQLPIKDNNALRSIAQVARAHWTSYALELAKTDYIVGNKRGRLRLLGLLLAMADLIDLSPVRANYFRSSHRLELIDVFGELHQTRHTAVRGYIIDRPEISHVLQLKLEWNGDCDEIRRMSEWTLHDMTHYYRQIRKPLRLASNGMVEWQDPWAKNIFHRDGVVRQLSLRASAILDASRAEQLRIDRETFVQAFLQALEEKAARLFVLPLDSDGDGSRMADWCLKHARSRENTLSVQVLLTDDDVTDLAGLAARLLEQWDEHLGDVDDDAALSKLERTLGERNDTDFVTVLRWSTPWTEWLERLVPALAGCTSESCGTRICILVCPGTEAPDFNGAYVVRPDWEEFTTADLCQHLGSSCGLDSEESADLAREAEQLGLMSPNPLYQFVRIRCRAWSNEDAA